MRIGAQMYTLRMYGQNERDLGRALEKVARIGYRDVQLSALGPIAPRRVKALCDANGLAIVLTHNPEQDFLTHPDELIEKHQIYGCRYVGLGYLPDDLTLTVRPEGEGDWNGKDQVLPGFPVTLKPGD